jgi:flagellar protein FlaJ
LDEILFFYVGMVLASVLGLWTIWLSLAGRPPRQQGREREPRGEKRRATEQPDHPHTAASSLADRLKKPGLRLHVVISSLADRLKRLKIRLQKAAREPPKGRAKVERPREPLSIRFVSEHDFTRRVAVQLAETIKDYIPRAALQVSPYRFVAQHVFWVFASLPVAAAAPFLAFLVHQVFLVLLFIPLLAFVMPWLRLRSMVGDHKRSVDAELPFFAVHAAVSQSAGLSIFESLCSTIGRGIFKEIEKAALIVKRNFKVLGMSPIAAIEKLGREHPHPGMRSLLLGYTSEFRSGGNVTRYLEEKADEQLRLTRYKYERYTKDVGTIMEMVLSALLVVPVVLVIGMALAPGEVTTLGLLFLALGIPAVLSLCFSMIRTMQPKDYTEYSGNPVLACLLAAPALAIAASALPIWTAVSVGLGIWSLLYGLPVILQRREALAHERSLPQFLRDVTERQKIGRPVARAIVDLRDQPGYTPAFRRLLEWVAKQLKMGRRLAEVKIPSRSWLTRMAFFHLGQIAETGGLSPKSTEMLTDFITRVKEARDEARSSVGAHRFIALATPLILAMIAGGMLGALEAFSVPETTQAPGGLELRSILSLSPSPILYAMMYAVIIFSGVSAAFLSSYATDFTPKNAVWVALGAFVVAASISIMPAVSGWITRIV